MSLCRICGYKKAESFKLKNREYSVCPSCRSICTAINSFETYEKQIKRYEQHNNNLNDEGYRKFLYDFINPVLQEISDISKERKKAPVKRILDYGSGPEPALCKLIKEISEKNGIICSKCEIRGWDPFFAPETPFFEGGADLVTCLEVAEHFETPDEDMKKLAASVKIGGYAAIGTMLIPEGHSKEKTVLNDVPECYNASERLERFKNWWYRSDFTHVAFYTRDGLIRCASNAGLSFIKAVTDRAFLFRKTV